ncbi:TPA: AlbA family DNA-binding domain-containing protein [Legionella pneumophila]
MDRAEEIFKLLQSHGEDEIDQFINSYQFENLFIDFKQIATKFDDKKLNDSDRKNYAKAISGFANSEGGVIVWGVECRNGPLGDVATDKKPTKEPNKFASYLEGITSSCTLPPHTSVCNEVIYAKDDKDLGYVISYIPKSENSPHQVITGDKRYNYYLRAGSNFEPIPHGILAGMFGRRPQPKLIMNFQAEPPIISDPTITFSFYITVGNNGLGLANKLYLALNVDEKPTNLSAKYDSLSERFLLMKAFADSSCTIISTTDFYLPPKAILHVLRYEITMHGALDENFVMTGNLGSENSAPISFKFSSAKDNLNKIYDEIAKSRWTLPNQPLNSYYENFLNFEVYN